MLVLGYQHTARVNLEQRAPSLATAAGHAAPPSGAAGTAEHERAHSLGTAEGHAAPPSGAAGKAEHGAGKAEHEVDTIGRDALKMWGEWDGLSPVMTQMMSQTHPAASPSATPATGREQGVRGRVRERSTRAEAADDHARAESLHRNGDINDDGTLEHDERATAPFPYVTAVFSLHGMAHELDSEERNDFKQSIADAVGLDAYGSGGMRAVLGDEAYEWITFSGGGVVNCSAVPHTCDDKGRRSVPGSVSGSVSRSGSVSEFAGSLNAQAVSGLFPPVARV